MDDIFEEFTNITSPQNGGVSSQKSSFVPAASEHKLAASTQASNSSTANDGSTSDAKWQAVSEIIKKRRIDEDSKRRQEEILQREEDLKTREEALAEKEHRFLVEKQEYYRMRENERRDKEDQVRKQEDERRHAEDERRRGEDSRRKDEDLRRAKENEERNTAESTHSVARQRKAGQDKRRAEQLRRRTVQDRARTIEDLLASQRTRVTIDISTIERIDKVISDNIGVTNMDLLLPIILNKALPTKLEVSVPAAGPTAESGESPALFHHSSEVEEFYVLEETPPIRFGPVHSGFAPESAVVQSAPEQAQKTFGFSGFDEPIISGEGEQDEWTMLDSIEAPDFECAAELPFIVGRYMHSHRSLVNRHQKFQNVSVIRAIQSKIMGKKLQAPKEIKSQLNPITRSLTSQFTAERASYMERCNVALQKQIEKIRPTVVELGEHGTQDPISTFEDWNPLSKLVLSNKDTWSSCSQCGEYFDRLSIKHACRLCHNAVCSNCGIKDKVFTPNSIGVTTASALLETYPHVHRRNTYGCYPYHAEHSHIQIRCCKSCRSALAKLHRLARFEQIRRASRSNEGLQLFDKVQQLKHKIVDTLGQLDKLLPQDSNSQQIIHPSKLNDATRLESALMNYIHEYQMVLQDVQKLIASETLRGADPKTGRVSESSAELRMLSSMRSSLATFLMDNRKLLSHYKILRESLAPQSHARTM